MKVQHIISDLHLRHSKIIGYCNRPFRDADHMDSEIVRRWNRVVNPHETVFVLGDVGFGSAQDLNPILDQLVGRIIVIRGNHDRNPILNNLNVIAWFPHAEIIHSGKRLLLTHKPQPELRKDFNGVLHGHIHNSTPEDRAKCGELSVIPPFNVNVSADAINFTPIRMTAAVKMLGRQLHRAKQ